MATTTLTATTFNNPPVYHHGPSAVTVTGTFNSGATAMGTAGDTVFLCKIPHGAVITGVREDHSSGATSSIYSLGLTTGGPGGSATVACFIASGAAATINRETLLAPASVSGAPNTSQGVPFLVSASDADPNRYGILSMTAASGQATATTSLIINWSVTYHDRGQF